MKKMIVLGLIMLATAACENRQRAGQEAGGSPPASGTPSVAREAASVVAPAATNHKILVTLQKSGSDCVVVKPPREQVKPGDRIRWKYKNDCKQGKKKPKIDLKQAPIGGGCENEIEVVQDDDTEGPDCTVSNAGPNVYYYGIYGDGIKALDPELEIPPPPPPPDGRAQPTPSAK